MFYILNIIRKLAGTSLIFLIVFGILGLFTQTAYANTYVTDTFSGTAGTTLSSHTTDTGQVWTVNPLWPGTVAKFTGTGYLYNQSGGAAWTSSYVPATADYDVSVVVNVKSAIAGSTGVGVVSRFGTTSTLSGYKLVYDRGAGVWQLGKFVSGTFTQLGTYSQALTIGRDYNVTLSAVGTSLRVFVDGVQRITVTDSSISAAGRAGIWLDGHAADNPLAGVQMANFNVTTVTAYTLTGPTSINTGQTSSNYTVTPNGNYNGTITLSDSAGGGIFTPSSLTFANSATPQTFTYLATTAGTKTISATSNPTLTDPTPLSVSVAAVSATTYTVTGPAQGTANLMSTNFTVTPYGLYTGTITVTPSGGGLSTPIVLSYSNSVLPQTFTITPTSAGTVTLVFTNNGGMTNPSNISYVSNPAATAYTITGPSTGNLNNPATFTVSPNGYYSGTITVTPSGGGLSTPTVLVFSDSITPQTFTINPTAGDPVTLTPTNNGNLTNPLAISYTASLVAFYTDTFTDTQGVLLSNHAGEMGSSYTCSTGAGANSPIINNVNQIRPNGTGGAICLVLNSPARTDYAVQADLVVKSIVGEGSYAIIARSDVAGNNFYLAQYNANALYRRWELYRRFNGTYTSLGTSDQTLVAGLTYTMKLTVVGTSIKLDVNGTNKITATNASVTAAGYSGILVGYQNLGNTPSDVTGIAMDNFTSPIAATYTLSGPTSVNTGQSSSSFTVTPTGYYTGTITPSDGSGGIFTPSILTFTNATSPQTFTYIPVSAGTKTISTTSSPGLTDPAALSVNATTGVVTALTMIGPASGFANVTSASFTVVPNGLYTGTVMIRPSGGGLSFPIVLNFSNSITPQTFTITPTSNGTVTLLATNDGGIANPTTLTYSVGLSPTIIPVNNAGLYYSPYSWTLSGSSYALSNSPGAYIKTNFTGTSAIINLSEDLFIAASENAGFYSRIAYQVDGGPLTDILLTSSTTSITAASGLAPGVHSLLIVFSGQAGGVSGDPDRWQTPVSSVKFTGLTVDSGATVSLPVLRSKTMLVYGDSISEGQRVNGVTGTSPNFDQDATKTVPWILASSLDAEVGFRAFGAEGWVTTGYGGVPPVFTPGNDVNSAWNKYYAGQSLLTGGLYVPAPDFIYINHGTNDSGAADATVTASVSGWLSAARTAAPNAIIFVVIPFGQFKSSAITLAYNNYIAANPADTKVFLVDLGSAGAVGVSSFGTPSAQAADGLHPYAATNITLAAQMLPIIQADIFPSVPRNITATAGNTTASVTFTAPSSNGGSTITGYTVTSIPAGGTDANAGSTSLAHSITGLTNGISYTFVVTAKNSNGTGPFSSASSPVTPFVPDATAFTLTGPSSGFINSNVSFTVVPNGVYTGNITIVPSGGGFSAPIVLNFNHSFAPQTFTVAPTVSGQVLLVPTNSSSLVNPVTLSYTVVSTGSVSGGGGQSISSTTLPVSSVSTAATLPATASTTNTVFTRTLQQNSKGSDVALLQKYLNTHGFPVSKKGSGSLGYETTTFGPATKAALIKFQKAKGIKPASGVFGPITKGYVEAHS